jgi:hypothetical protein
MKNKLWFFGSFRQAYYDKPIANTFQTDGSLPYPQAYASCAARPDRASRASRTRRWPTRSAPHLADLGAQQVRRLHGSRAAPARPRHGRADRSEHRVGDLEHAAVHDRIGEVDRRRCRRSCCSRPGSRSIASTTTTCISPASTPSAARPEWYRNVRKDDTSTGYLWNASSAQLGNYPDRFVSRVALVRDRRAQHQVRRDGPVRHVSPLQQRQRRSLSDLPERRAAARHRAQHAARSAGEPRRQLRHLRPGLSGTSAS